MEVDIYFYRINVRRWNLVVKDNHGQYFLRIGEPEDDRRKMM